MNTYTEASPYSEVDPNQPYNNDTSAVSLGLIVIILVAIFFYWIWSPTS